MKKSSCLVLAISLLTSFRAPHLSPVWGVFEGRVPCKEMAREINVPVENSCELLKWRFTFYKNPHTGALIETRGGNHTALKKWKSTYGGAVVEGWRID